MLISVIYTSVLGFHYKKGIAWRKHTLPLIIASGALPDGQPDGSVPDLINTHHYSPSAFLAEM
jgi:hypothetical protein